MAVYKRGSRWHYGFSINGVRYRGKIPEARTKTEAERVEIQIRQSVYDGKYGAQTSPYFKEFFETTYLPWAKQNKRSYPRGDAVYAIPLVKFFGAYRIGEIVPLLIEKYKKERLETPTKHGTTRAPASVNLEIACLSRAFSLAVENSLIQYNPCSRVRKFRTNNKRKRYLSWDEEKELMKALDKAPAYLKPIVVMAIQTGMRKGELLKLEWRDVNFSRGTIYMRDTKDPTSDRDREIPMSSIARETLEQLSLARTDERVFPFTEFKKPWATACTNAKLEDLHFHDLRHTAATRWADAGATPKEISELLGNSILVGERYTHAIRENLKRVMETASKQKEEAKEATVHEFRARSNG